MVRDAATWVPVVLTLLLASAAPARAADWKAIEPGELALKAPKVQPDAAAEALFWEVRITDEIDLGVGPSTVFERASSDVGALKSCHRPSPSRSTSRCASSSKKSAPPTRRRSC